MLSFWHSPDPKGDTVTDAHRALHETAAAWAADGFGQFEVVGPDAHAFVNRVTTVDISTLAPGRFADALMLRDDATILGRVTVYRFPDRVMLLVEAAQRAATWQELVDRKRGNIRLRDISDDVGVTVVRGPAAATRLATLLEPMPTERGDVRTARLAGVDVFAARAGTDAPDGIDLYCRVRDVASLRSAIARLAIPFATDADWELFRLERGVARVGIEIAPDDTPIEAGLDALVAQGKGAPFPGEVALAGRRRTGPIKRLVGVQVAGDVVPAVGAEVRVNGRVVDRLRSAARSPRAGVIGMTAVPVGADPVGTPLEIVDGGRVLAATVAARPFTSGGVS